MQRIGNAVFALCAIAIPGTDLTGASGVSFSGTTPGGTLESGGPFLVTP
jgi:hypothetical protein